MASTTLSKPRSPAAPGPTTRGGAPPAGSLTVMAAPAVPELELSPRDLALLAGEGTAAEQISMRLIVALARAMGAAGLLDVSSAHIDSCLYHGQAGLDFASRLADGGGAVRVPTTLNVSSLDLLHPDLYRGDPEAARRSRAQMACYERMGCRPTWTCAPYQLAPRPAFGEHVAWAESNAIVFANSVLGARTHRYGDFVDIAAAITGRAPAAGLHLDGPRRARIVFDVRPVAALLDHDATYPALGHLVGRRAGALVPALIGLPASTGEDRLKALGAASASSGAVAMFHAVGVTPEAPTLEAALGGQEPADTVVVDGPLLADARDELTTATGDELDAVSLGTPHYSLAELGRLAWLFAGRRASVPVYASTGRDVLTAAAAAGTAEALEAAGVQVVVDTCTYVTPLLDPRARTVMTDSGKWAYYAPGNLGVAVVFGSMEECVESAVTGSVRRDPAGWADA